jgi:hypothetical protein
VNVLSSFLISVSIAGALKLHGRDLSHAFYAMNATACYRFMSLKITILWEFEQNLVHYAPINTLDSKPNPAYHAATRVK